MTPPREADALPLPAWVEANRRHLPWYDDPARPAYLNTAGMALRPRDVIDGLAARAADPLAAAAQADRARRAVAAFVGADPADVVPVMGAHTAFERLFALQEDRPGDYLYDPLCHQAVLGPLRRLERLGIARPVAAPCAADGTWSVDGIAARIGPRTRAVVVTQVSSVTGTIQPLRALARAVRRRADEVGADPLLVVDGAQAAPRIPLDLRGVDAWVMACQKVGALAGAAVVLADRAYALLSGSRDAARARAEVAGTLAAGTPHAEALGSVADALEFLSRLSFPGEPPRAGVAAAHLVLHDLAAPLIAGLAATPGVSVYGPSGERANHNAGIVAFNVRGVQAADLGAALAGRGFLVRAGVPDHLGHCFCVPEAARVVPDLERHGGAVRASLGWHTHPGEVRALADAVAAVARA